MNQYIKTTLIFANFVLEEFGKMGFGVNKQSLWLAQINGKTILLFHKGRRLRYRSRITDVDWFYHFRGVPSGLIVPSEGRLAGRGVWGVGCERTSKKRTAVNLSVDDTWQDLIKNSDAYVYVYIHECMYIHICICIHVYVYICT